LFLVTHLIFSASSDERPGLALASRLMSVWRLPGTLMLNRTRLGNARVEDEIDLS